MSRSGVTLDRRRGRGASIRPRNLQVDRAASPMPTPAIADDLVGRDTGAPLDPALFLLPGDNLSNAPEIVVDRLDLLDAADRQQRPQRACSMSMPA